MSTYRFEKRSTTTSDYRFVTGFFAGLPSASNVLNGVDRGDGVLGTAMVGLSKDNESPLLLESVVEVNR